MASKTLLSRVTARAGVCVPLELVFKDDEVIVHVVRASHCSGVVCEVLDEHRP